MIMTQNSCNDAMVPDCDTEDIGVSTQYIVYISGKMAGLPDYGYAAFDQAASQWREAGYTVVSPAENFGGNTNLQRNNYLKIDYNNLINSCNAIAVLPNWRDSVGARAEMTIAQSLGYPVFNALNPGEHIKIEADATYYAKQYQLGLFTAKKILATRNNSFNSVDNGQARKVVDTSKSELRETKPVEDSKESVCQIADRLVTITRRADYGHPKDDFQRIADMATALGFRFQNDKGELRNILPADHGIWLILTKVSREMNSHKRDNLIDGAGYFKCLDLVHGMK